MTSYWHADCTTDFLGDTFPSLIIPFSGFRSWCRNIRPSLRCPCTIDWQFSRPARLIFPSGTSRPIGNIHTHRMRVERFSWAFRAGPPSPLACLPLARQFFLGPVKSTACTKKMYHSNIFSSFFFLFFPFSHSFFLQPKQESERIFSYQSIIKPDKNNAPSQNGIFWWSIHHDH